MQADGTWTILVVDDDAFVREPLAQLLDEDYHTLSASSGHEGLSILDRESIDLLLCSQRLSDPSSV